MTTVRFIPARAGNTSSPAAAASRPSVHPRSRGEHQSAASPIQPRVGSSPLARGTQRQRLLGGDPNRFIPARAGNTPRCGIIPAWTPVHPRSRGEHFDERLSRPRVDGSSPLARGTRRSASCLIFVRRFIPARAGNTAIGVTGRDLTPVHPRSRGEHEVGDLVGGAGNGSSPLARGTRTRTEYVLVRRRFIPARAGNTGAPSATSGWLAVHPRSRGEHRFSVRTKLSVTGSSPLARGTLPPIEPVPEAARFIPARAGNTAARRRACRRWAVHPRSRGEHSNHRRAFVASSGSSPLARGTPRPPPPSRWPHRFIPARAGNTVDRVCCRTRSPVHPRSRGEHARKAPAAAAASRFIPARAGNTRWSRPTRGSTTVHPRSRGEHPRQMRRSYPGHGSSPLARGTPLRTAGRRRPHRFIPARAGNTAGSCGCCTASPVHPRSRGEHRSIATTTPASSGSSPLARGTRRRSRGAGPADTVHPRSRGEHRCQRSPSRRGNGSSPLARGTQGGELSAREKRRFIPARAGNTGSAWPPHPALPVHPRSRGEHR